MFVSLTDDAPKANYKQRGEKTDDAALNRDHRDDQELPRVVLCHRGMLQKRREVINQRRCDELEKNDRDNHPRQTPREPSDGSTHQYADDKQTCPFGSSAYI